MLSVEKISGIEIFFVKEDTWIFLLRWKHFYFLFIGVLFFFSFLRSGRNLTLFYHQRSRTASGKGFVIYFKVLFVNTLYTDKTCLPLWRPKWKILNVSHPYSGCWQGSWFFNSFIFTIFFSFLLRRWALHQLCL